MKNLRTTNWPNKTTARTMTTFLMGPFPKSRAATCQERQKGHGRRVLVAPGARVGLGGAQQQGEGDQCSGTHPATPLRDPPGDGATQHEVGHEAGHLAQEAGQAALVDVEGQAVAEAQQSHHAAPVDTALKQAAGRGDAVAGDPWGGLWKAKMA